MLDVRRTAAAIRKACRSAPALVSPVLDLLLPAECFVCGEPLGPLQSGGACLPCWTLLAPIRRPVCAGCGLPLPGGTDLSGPAGGRCGSCVVRPLGPEEVRAAVLYQGAARRFLLRAKLGHRPELLEALGDMLACVAAAELADACTAVVPVPSDPWTRWCRGFDPALELARPVARRLGRPLRAEALHRSIRLGIPAKRLPARLRARAVRSVFRSRGRLDGMGILLVDDVLTTGATAGACAAALRRAGAERVVAAVWARTPREPAH